MEASSYNQPDEKTRLVDLKYTKSVGFVDGAWDTRNYHIPWQHIYNLVAELLEILSREKKIKISNLKLGRLFVPSVELVAKQYQIKQELGELGLKILDENVNKHIIITYVTDKEFGLQNQIKEKDNIIFTLNQEKTTLQNELNSLPAKKQRLELANLEQDLKNKELQSFVLKKELGNKFVKNININYIDKNSAKTRIQNHLSYKLGQALIENSKSILGYIRMLYVLSYIKDKHKFEQKAYEEKIKENPNLALPPLETYPDYNEALKEKECFTYKLGEALMQANKNWYGGGYIKFAFKDVPRLKREYNKN